VSLLGKKTGGWRLAAQSVAGRRFELPVAGKWIYVPVRPAKNIERECEGGSLLQLDKREEFWTCVLELIELTGSRETSQTRTAAPDIIYTSLSGDLRTSSLSGPYASQVEELLGEAMTGRSA